MNDPENKRTIGFLWAGLVLFTLPPDSDRHPERHDSGRILAPYWLMDDG